MKRLFFTFILFLILSLSFTSLFAQHQGINYQAVARDAANNLLSNSTIGVRFTLNSDGIPVFQETQITSTNEYGLFSLVIGDDKPGLFSNIDWTEGEFKLKIEIDPGTGYVDLGERIIQSVPFSKVATEMKLEDLTNVADTSATIGQVMKWNGQAWVPEDPDNSAWSLSNGDISFTGGRVGIGTTTPINSLHIVHGVPSRTAAKIETGILLNDRDVLQLKVDLQTPDNAQFIELKRGDTTKVRINADGSAEFQAVKFPDGSVQTKASIGPIAYGFVKEDGTIESGSGNFTVFWNTSSNRYEISIQGENYFWENYTTLVTPSSSSIYRFRVSSVSGNLLVYLNDSLGSLSQGHFQFMTFK